VVISGNTIRDVASSTTSGDSVFACGVLLGLMGSGDLDFLKVNDNQITDIGEDSTAHSAGVYVEPAANDLLQVSIDNNQVYGTSSASSGSFAGIRVNNSGDIEHLSVCSNNIIYASFSSSLTKDGIEIDATGTGHKINCSGNQIHTLTSDWTCGITVTANGGGIWYVISNNSVVDFTNTGILIADDALNVVISGNNLYSGDGSLGVQINDDVDYAAINNNVIRLVGASSTGIYAFCTASYNWVISGNSIAVLYDNGRGVYLSNVNQHIVIGNLVEIIGSTGTAPRSLHTTFSTEGSIIGNRWDSVATQNYNASDDLDANYTW
jgi:hypothetical protein